MDTSYIVLEEVKNKKIRIQVMQQRDSKTKSSPTRGAKFYNVLMRWEQEI